MCLHLSTLGSCIGGNESRSPCIQHECAQLHIDWKRNAILSECQGCKDSSGATLSEENRTMGTLQPYGLRTSTCLRTSKRPASASLAPETAVLPRGERVCDWTGAHGCLPHCVWAPALWMRRAGQLVELANRQQEHCSKNL